MRSDDDKRIFSIGEIRILRSPAQNKRNEKQDQKDTERKKCFFHLFFNTIVVDLSIFKVAVLLIAPAKISAERTPIFKLSALKRYSVWSPMKVFSARMAEIVFVFSPGTKEMCSSLMPIVTSSFSSKFKSGFTAACQMKFSF